MSGLVRSGYTVSGDRIRAELDEFFEQYPTVSGRALAREAGLQSGTLNRIQNCERSDIRVTTATDIRKAIRRLRVRLAA